MIELKNIEKYYENGIVKTFVLRRIDLQIREGEFVSIMGPSGAGKSTLLHILGMLDTASNGEYHFYNRAVHKLDERALTELHRDHIGFVFQSYHLIDELTVGENLETPLLYQKVKGAERKGRIAEMLDRFNIVAKKRLFPNQLSGGQQQLVGIARALITQPKIDPGRRTNRQLKLGRRRADHDPVQTPECRRRNHCPMHTLREKRRLRRPHRTPIGRMVRPGRAVVIPPIKFITRI